MNPRDALKLVLAHRHQRLLVDYDVASDEKKVESFQQKEINGEKLAVELSGDVIVNLYFYGKNSGDGKQHWHLANMREVGGRRIAFTPKLVRNLSSIAYEVCKQKPTGEIHHIDLNHSNDRLSNYLQITPEEHKALSMFVAKYSLESKTLPWQAVAIPLNERKVIEAIQAKYSLNYVIFN